MNNKAVLITGATGYIGNHLALHLAEAGHVVHALCKSPGKRSLLRHKNIQCFEGDILDRASLFKAMQGCGQAYHLAAYARVWAKDPDTYYAVNVTGTRNVLDAAKVYGVEKIVFTSTAGVLGPSKNNPVREDDIRVLPFFNEYERSKAIAEEKIKEYAAEGQEAVIVSPPRVYGPGLASESNAVTKMIRLYLNGKWRILPGSGEGIGSYAYIQDVVEGHIKAMEKGRSGERYILGGINASYKTLFQTIAHACGFERRLYKVPVPLMVVFAQTQLLWTAVTNNSPLITPSWVRKYGHHWALSSKKAEQELGYAITPLEKGIGETVQWIKSNEHE